MKTLQLTFKEMKKMADVDTDPFSEHDKTDEQPDTDETICFTSGGVIQSREPEHKTFRGGKTQSTRLKEVWVKGLY